MSRAVVTLGFMVLCVSVGGLMGVWFATNTECLTLCQLEWKSIDKDFKPPNKVPVKTPPDHLREAYTMFGRAKIMETYSNDVYLGKTAHTSVWPAALVNSNIRQVEAGLAAIASGTNPLGYGSYGGDSIALYRAFKAHPILGMTVLVVGSENPWVESLVLAHGATSTITLEYGKITSEHPKVKTMTPPEFIDALLHNKLPRIDAIVSFSSLEHDGLGRYGDPLNPWGDIEIMQRFRCLLPQGGRFYLAVPFASEDCTVFNVHRVYGPVRQTLLFQSWKLLGIYDTLTPWKDLTNCFYAQPVSVLEKYQNE